jgi:hypothetical protein
MTDDQITTMHDGDVSRSLAVRQTDTSGDLTSISANLPGIGLTIWNNPFAGCHFSDEQIAVATVLERMAKGITKASGPAYAAEEFLADIEIVQALRYSAEAGGRTISLPLKEKMEKARRLASPGLWKRKIFNRRRVA